MGAARTRKEIALDLSNPIVLAVLPLKEQALQAQRLWDEAHIERMRRKLEEHGYDIEKAAPYPSPNLGRYDYARVRLQRAQMDAITRWQSPTHRHGEPLIVTIDPKLCEKFILEGQQQAAYQFDSYAAKLTYKIGAVVSAELLGHGVWTCSNLIVVLPSGEKQVWHTKGIMNCSKLGKHFPQFPTRKVKEPITYE
ncbi:MAG: hypothetical protein E6R03_17030 [Hyphomicrobiaceae bacterium]|nr:MAG: hypothetical protein E6R03_17030 [Hyphomicrobiaceae bacterium]